jgi:hypothetical protein
MQVVPAMIYQRQTETNMKRLLPLAALTAVLIPQPANAALVALYQFDDVNDLGLDTSGNGNNATNFGAGFETQGYQGGAASFSFDAFLRAPVDVNRAILPNMTWGAWVRPNVGGGAIQAVLSNDDGGFDRQIGIDNRGGVSSWSSFTGTNVYNPGIAPLTSGWTFLAAVYNQSQYSMDFYVNGQAFTTTTNFGGSPASFAIGRNLTFQSHFSGLIDNVFVYEEALTADQIATLRATGFPSAQAPVGAVPEPSAWAMMLLGFGFVGSAMRRSKKPRAMALAA